MTVACLSPPFRSSQTACCYTYGLLSAGCGMTVPHDSLARYYRQGLRKINCAERQIRRCRALQRAYELRDTGMSRLRRLNRMCSSTVSDTANRLRKTRKKKSSAVSLFRSGRRSPIFAGLSKQGKGRSSKRKGNRRCPFLFVPAADAAVSRAPQSANHSLGNRKVMQVPSPSALFSSTSALCSAAPCLTIESPNPVPPVILLWLLSTR